MGLTKRSHGLALLDHPAKFYRTKSNDLGYK